MATAILINTEVDTLCLGDSIEAILKRKGPLTLEGIRDALLTTDLGDGEYIDASVEEIQELLETLLIPDDDVVQVGETFRITVPYP